MNTAQNNIRNKKITTFIVFIMQIIGKKSVIYFYCTEDPDKFNTQNPKKGEDFSPEYLEKYRSVVGDLIYLSDDFATVELELSIQGGFVPNRPNLQSGIQKKSLCSFYLTILRLIIETIILLIILIDKIVSDEFYCLNEVFEDIKIINNNTLNTIINNNVTSDETSTTNYNNITFISKTDTKFFWYCKLGKCKVKKKKWRLSKIIRVLHIIFFYCLILGYQYYLFFTLERITINNIYILFIYNIIGYICLILIFYLNYTDDKICSVSKIDNNVICINLVLSIKRNKLLSHYIDKIF